MARSNELASIRTRRGLVAVSTVLGGVSVITACKSATYIDVLVSGDSTLCSLETAKPTRFSLYSRRPGPIVDGDDGHGPDGELTTCKREEVRTFYFGNFTVDPIEGKSDAVLVEMRVNTSGASSGDGCAADDKGKIPNTCVVVRRTLRFDSGRRLELPMYLDDRCLGVSCEQDKTCFRGGCVSADVTCDAAGCLTEAERAASAGFDPSKLAGLPPGPDGTDDAGRKDGGSTADSASAEDGAPPADADAGLADASTGEDGGFSPSEAGADANSDASLGGYVNQNCSMCPQSCCAMPGTLAGPFACRPVCAQNESNCTTMVLADGGPKVMCTIGIF